MLQSVEGAWPPRDAGRPHQARGLRRRSAILEAASTLIDEHGWRSPEVTIQAIARGADSAPATIYHYFVDMDAVLGAVTLKFMEGLTNAVELSSQSSIDFAVVAHLDIEARLRYFRAHPGLRDLWFDHRASPAVVAIHERFQAISSSQIEHRMAGSGRAPKAPLAYMIFVRTSRALWELAFDLDKQGHPAVVEEIERLTVRLASDA